MVASASPASEHQPPSSADLRKSQWDQQPLEQQVQQKQTQRGPSGLPLPPLLRLPPEIILRIIAFVARLGVPSDLARLRATSTTFCLLLNDTGRSVEQSIWRGAASALLGAYTPSALTLEPSWQEFVKRTWRISKPSKAAVGPEDDDDDDDDSKCPIRRFDETEELFTGSDGPSPRPSSPPASFGQDLEGGGDQGPQMASLSLGPIPDGARRVIDFVHSGTEGSRAVSGVGFCGADAGAFFTHTLDPRHWLDRETLALNRGFILGGKAGDKRDAMLTIADVVDVSNTVMRLSEDESLVEPHGFGEWARSCVHSDANLSLVPRLAKPASVEVEAAEVVVKFVARYSSPGVVDKVWDLENVAWEGTHLTARGQRPGFPWTNGANWEFRSAGDFLVICDDNNGRRASTITCFASGKCTAPLWQRTMDGQMEDSLGQPHPFFYDNDGIRMNSAFVAYACRLKASAADPPNVSVNRSVMEFVLMSTETGRTLSVLSIPQQDRPQRREGGEGLCSWCSFSLSESILVATLGGRTTNDNLRTTYQFPEAFVWDLTVPHSFSSSPTYTIRPPNAWYVGKDSWTALSPDGRWLGIQSGWEIVVWDLETQSQVGRWRTARAEKYERIHVLDSPDLVFGWSSLWVKYRDIYDSDSAPAPPANMSREEQDRTKESSPGSSHAMATQPRGKVVHGVACYTSRVLRRIFQRTEAQQAMGGDQQWNEYPESIFSSSDGLSDEDSSSDEYLDAFDDDDDGGLSDMDYGGDIGYFGGFDDDDDYDDGYYDDGHYDEGLDGGDGDINEGLDPDGGGQEEVVDESSVGPTGTRGDGNTTLGSATSTVADLADLGGDPEQDYPTTIEIDYDDGDGGNDGVDFW